MPDRQKCTCTTAPQCSPPPPPPPPTDPSEPLPHGDGDNLFRHTFLWRLRNPDDREALLRLGRGFDEYLSELGWFGADDDSVIAGMADALADDVEALAAYSLTIARVCEGSAMGVSDAGIFYFAPRWAERLALMAEQMRTVVLTARDGVS